MCAFSRNETSDLCHEGNQGSLSQQGRLTGHVRSGNDDNLLFFCVQIYVVGNILFAQGELLFNDRMPSLTDIQYIIVGHYRTDIPVGFGYTGKRQKAVQPGNLGSIDLDRRNKFGQCHDQFIIKPCFQNQNFVFCSEDLFFIFFQLLSDIAFCIYQSLLAYPFSRNLVFMRIADFNVIAEYIIICNFQAGNTSLFNFALLNLQQIIFTRIGNSSQFVKFFVDSVRNDSSFIDQQGRIILYLTGYLVTDGYTEVQLFSDSSQAFVFGIQAGILDRFDSLKGNFQLYDFAWRDSSYCRFGNNTFQVADQMKFLFNKILEIRLPEEIFHHVQPLIDGLHIFQREYDPAFQQSCSHGTDGMVDDIQ